VSAFTFPEDTTFSKGDIDFIFKEGVVVEDFQFISQGIIIDDYRIVIVPEGGEIVVTVSEWGEDKKLLVKSNAPQDLAFKITSGGVKYYVYDGEQYVIDEYEIDVEEVEWEFRQFEDNRMIDNVVTVVESGKWLDKVVVFFEVPELSTTKGDVGGRIVFITYKTTLIGTLIIVALIMFIAIRGRK
jgi:hypothetical protein